MVTIGTKSYVFGGFSRKMYNDLREFDAMHEKWTFRAPDYNIHEARRPKEPAPRSSHTMVAYKETLIVFGGAGEFM